MEKLFVFYSDDLSNIPLKSPILAPLKAITGFDEPSNSSA
jgi:hypothetical protein